MVIDFDDQEAVKNMVEKVNTVVVGPGLGEESESRAVLDNVFSHTQPDQAVVIDGSAITMIAKQHIQLPKGHLIFTPHQMEWQRLSGIKISDQVEAANREKVDQLGGIVVLKKHHSEIYTADNTYQLPNGPINCQMVRPLKRLVEWATLWLEWSVVLLLNSGPTSPMLFWLPLTLTAP